MERLHFLFIGARIWAYLALGFIVVMAVVGWCKYRLNSSHRFIYRSYSDRVMALLSAAFSIIATLMAIFENKERIENWLAEYDSISLSYREGVYLRLGIAVGGIIVSIAYATVLYIIAKKTSAYKKRKLKFILENDKYPQA